MKVKVTDWFESATSPHHVGWYEIETAGGEIRRARYSSKGWSELDVRRWRGRDVRLSTDGVNRRRAAIGRHRDSPAYKQAAGEAARALGRDAVVKGKSAATIAFCFQVAVRLGVKLLVADRAQMVKASKKTTLAGRAEIERKFADLSIPPLQIITSSANP
jgi:hypothetical protein